MALRSRCTVALALALVACRGDDGGSFYGTGTGGDSDTGESEQSNDELETGPILDLGDASEAGGDPCNNEDGDATLTGIVYAPNQELPIADALVWASKDAPEPIPNTVYCNECVELECMTPYEYTNPDGSFALELDPGTWFIGVQKGQFRRVFELEVEAGTTALEAGHTSLPDHHDPAAGLTIPKIAVGWGAHDRIEDALAKLGLGDIELDPMYSEVLMLGTEQFDIWDNGDCSDWPDSNCWGEPESKLGTLEQLLSNYVLLEQYHILFLPCSNDKFLAVMEDPAVVENLREWVASGGKLYVADWSAEFLEYAFNGYQDFWRRMDTNKPDTLPTWADDPTTDLGSYDAIGTILDPDLQAWLAALPEPLKDINPQNPNAGEPYPIIDALPMLQTVNLWSGVKATYPVLVDDGEGGQVDVGHKVWIEGPGSSTWGVPPVDEQHPLTITGEYGCGKIMFTAYHTAENGKYIGLTPQELVLMYLILDIGVCQEPYDVPPVP
ncbi:MAG TPA: hypothetical protein VM869_13975 [Enhygromyxa sp.]|nr:hypothetical protein [Enhygromyxa sp.]